MTLPDFFWIGPQKAASTWVYRCFQEHPEIYVHEDEDLSGLGGDALHYYDMHYAKGTEWYQQFFDDYSDEKIAGDTTPSYLRSPKAPGRIANEIPDAKLITCLRDPIDRAFSHYWHEKKKRKISFDFEELLVNYDLYQNWLESGFYYEHISKYLEYFDRDQMLLTFMGDLKNNDHEFIADVFDFLGVKSGFEPSVLDEKVNTAGYLHDLKAKAYRTVARASTMLGIKEYVTHLNDYRLKQHLTGYFLNKSEYERGVDPELRNELIDMITPEVRKLEELIDRDLDHWLEKS